MDTRPIIIAIDGPAGAGKSTVSRVVAKRLGYLYLDTGAMYRAVALAAKTAGVDTKDHQALATLCNGLDISFDNATDPPAVLLNGQDVSAQIRTPEIDMLASCVSAIKAVREAMTGLQRKVAQEAREVVAEGRDMGTVVFPNARCKFFLTASPEERARRRYEELVQRGETIDKNAVAKEMEKRDQQDSTRSIAPLKPAPDAVIIDTTHLSIEEVVNKICETVASKISHRQK